MLSIDLKGRVCDSYDALGLVSGAWQIRDQQIWEMCQFPSTSGLMAFGDPYTSLMASALKENE